MPMRVMTGRGLVAVGVLLALAVILWAGAVRLNGRGGPEKAAPPEPRTRAELRSWVVVGRGRHLYLQILPAQGIETLAGRVEFTATMLRSDYLYTADQSGIPRVARMRGEPLRPPSFAGQPDNRLEAVYEIGPEQARCLQRDRVFSAPYVLIGANSNAGLRRVMEECGLALPQRIVDSHGLLGEFPGIDQEVGDELPPALWPSHGIAPD